MLLMTLIVFTIDFTLTYASPLISFQCFDYEFVVVSLHIDALDSGKKKKKSSATKDVSRREETKVEGNGTREVTKTNPCQLTPLVTALKQKLSNEKNIILLGDFNMSPDNGGECMEERDCSV